MINNISGGKHITLRKHHHKAGHIPEEELARRQLMRDVISRLDYNDVKKSVLHDRKRFHDSTPHSMKHGSRTEHVTPAPDVILPKIERILIELRQTEEKGTIRMKQIEISLAELGFNEKRTAG